MAESSRHRSSLKQQNKPFKGRSKSAKEKSGRTVPTSIHTAEWVSANKLSRKNTAVQKRKNQREASSRKNRGIEDSIIVQPKLIGVLAMNIEADCEEIKSLVSAEFASEKKNADVCVQVIQRNEVAVLDWGKIVDAVVLVISCKNADVSKAKLDPSTCCAFDETAYNLLSLLKTQGLPPVVGILQHLDLVVPKKQKDVKKLFTRYYESEFPNSLKICNTSKPESLIRALKTSMQQFEEPVFKSFRSYLWAHSVTTENNLLQVTGYLKGSGSLSPNQLVHITGYGDYSIFSVKTPNGEFFPSNPESLVAENDPGTFASEQTWPNESDLVDAFSKLEVKTDHPPNDADDEEDEGELNISDDEKQPFEFEERPKDDFDFPDEVNTPHDQPARLRFQKYRGMASFRTSEWDPYENLPVSYSKIFEFKEPNHIIKKTAVELVRDANVTSVGLLVTITVNGFPTHLVNSELPLILSTILPHERKLSVLNFKLERWGNTEESLKSKETLCFHYGFRRVLAKPIYSEDSNSEKAKYLREFKDTGFVIASIFAPVNYPPANVLAFKETMEGVKLVAVGSLLSFDPKRIIIKRILLTGYPLKIHKRKAVVRYMFIEPKDIRYFKPIELFTKSGLRGHIKESLGTHGNMKCVFNDFIKHGDIVCMPLYKRVFPVWDESTWKSLA